MARTGLAFTRGYLDKPTLAIWLERWMETQGRDGELMTFLMARHSMGESMGRVDEWIVKDGQTSADLLPIVWDRLEEYALGLEELEPQFKFVPHFGKERVAGPPSPFKFRKPLIDEVGQAADGGEDALVPTMNERSFARFVVAQNVPERKLNQAVNAENFRQLLAVNQALASDNHMLRSQLSAAEITRQRAFESWQTAADTSLIRKLDAEKQAKSDARKDAVVGKVAMLIPFAIQMGLKKWLGPQAAALLGTTSNPQLEKLKGALARLLNDEKTLMSIVQTMTAKDPVAANVVMSVIQEWTEEAHAAKAKIDEGVQRMAGPDAAAALPAVAVPDTAPGGTELAKAP